MFTERVACPPDHHLLPPDRLHSTSRVLNVRFCRCPVRCLPYELGNQALSHPFLNEFPQHFSIPKANYLGGLRLQARKPVRSGIQPALMGAPAGRLS
jgi:hypothetical protein